MFAFLIKITISVLSNNSRELFFYISFTVDNCLARDCAINIKHLNTFLFKVDDAMEKRERLFIGNWNLDFYQKNIFFFFEFLFFLNLLNSLRTICASIAFIIIRLNYLLGMSKYVFNDSRSDWYQQTTQWNHELNASGWVWCNDKTIRVVKSQNKYSLKQKCFHTNNLWTWQNNSVADCVL